MDEERDEVTPAETARARRRDRRAEASSRAGMNTGLAKQFKQVLDAQVKRADEARRAEAPEPGTGSEPAVRSKPAPRGRAPG